MKLNKTFSEGEPLESIVQYMSNLLNMTYEHARQTGDSRVLIAACKAIEAIFNED